MGLVKRAVLSALIVMAAGCGGKERAALDAVRAQMLDPESAQFRNVRSVRNRYGEVGICGEVNAKNSLGGYAGFRHFMAQGGRVVLQSRDDEALASFQASHFADCLDLPPDHLSREERETYEAFRGP